MSSMITPLLERNEAFAEIGKWRNTSRLPFLPFKHLYVITCLDPRTDPADFLGGRVTDAVIRDLAYIGYLVETLVPEAPYFEAAVIHHTDCGSRLLDRAEVRRGFAERSGYDESLLASLPATHPRESVKADIDKILAAPQISSRITVSGHVSHTETGRLETVNESRLVGARTAR